MKVRSLLVLTSLLALAACASVPLSTMWKMRSFTVDGFFARDPRELRVALQVDGRLLHEPSDPKIDIRIEGMSPKPVCFAFPLKPVDPAASTELPLEKSPPGRRWYAYGLSQQGLEAFDRARRDVRVGKLDGGKFSLNVSIGDMEYPESVKTVPFRIDLALDRKDGWFTLIKETTITIDRSRPYKAGTAQDAVPVITC